MDFVYPKAASFICVNCGICCGDTKEKKRHILMLREEADQISIKTDKKISDFASLCINKSPYFFEMKKNDKGNCVFLSPKNKCDIYSNRPLICRCYPFELVNQNNGIHKFSSTNECPGINHGKLLDKKYFIDLFEIVKIRFQNLNNFN
jgi:Fe-S-cluster containining protein